jgi:hypothetical protein
MNEGWWVNIATGRYVELTCAEVDHEVALRDPRNQAWLNIPPSVTKGFGRFTRRTDRDAMLRYAMKRSPIMRIRGHGGKFTTVEYSSVDEHPVMLAIRKWAKRFAAPTTMLNVVNVATRKGKHLTVADVNRNVRLNKGKIRQ